MMTCPSRICGRYCGCLAVLVKLPVTWLQERLTNNSGKPILNADIFGRIYDKNNNPVMQNRGRLGGVDYVPPW